MNQTSGGQKPITARRLPSFPVSSNSSKWSRSRFYWIGTLSAGFCLVGNTFSSSTFNADTSATRRPNGRQINQPAAPFCLGSGRGWQHSNFLLFLAVGCGKTHQRISTKQEKGRKKKVRPQDRKPGISGKPVNYFSRFNLCGGERREKPKWPT